jgi:outer membrane protein OmpA-like peptidoglycan-associated protein
MIFSAGFIFAQDTEEPKKEPKKKRSLDQIKKAYAYMEEELLVTETDLYCSYFITPKRIPEDLLIIGAEEMDTHRIDYTDGDRMFINKGASVGTKEGELFLVLTKGVKVDNLLTGGKLGIYYLQKSLAEVYCLYENRSLVTLKKGCHPVNIGDILIPFKLKQTVFKKKIDYKRCYLPDSPVEGVVVFNRIPHIDLYKELRGPEEYVTIDVGKAMVSVGNFVIFYKILRKDLPPVIFGSGVIVNPQNTNSTIKILESSWPVELGARMILVPKSEEPISGEEKAEEIPIIKTLEKEERAVEPGEETREVNILFDMNQKSIDDPDKYAEDFENIKAFSSSKSQYVVVLRGYTCSIGGLEYNLKLSKERVESVKAYLIQALGIPGNLIETYYYGETDAPFDNTSEEQRRKNRTVNIQVIGK